ncbi:hypothetical protein OGAPHI_004291 [Ogataea philodendri]|uniref:Uncharacterized protein n=1 Tax=Ogataea philodendri TaxID=1378263 RepID=A0A9P8P791_9ASCO|nr:uncharacterized protein OGAPHI_004291 [Ogataea philodendri]KAH3666102.1 hypothetical protein OGAPHI_004291 [Ogataea philodendri]
MSNHFNEGLQGKSYKFRSKPPIDPTKEEDVIDKFLNLNSYTPVQEGSPEGFPNSQQLDPGTNMQHSSSFDGLQPTPSSKKPAFLDESSMFLSSNSESYSNQASNNSYNFIGSSQDFPTVPSLETPPQQPYIHFEDAISDNKSPTSAESTAPLIQIDKAFAEYISLQSEMTEFPQPTTMDRYSSNQFERDVTQYNTNPSFFLQPQAAGQYIQTESSTGSDLSASNSPYLSAVESIVSGDLNERGDDLEGLQMSEDIRQLSLSAIATPNINLTEHNLREQERISSAPPIVIENPENLAKRTPSLFSASSSRASSPNRSGSGSYTGGPHITSGDHSFTPEISIKVEDTSNPHTVDSSSYSTPDHEKLYTGNYLQADDAVK